MKFNIFRRIQFFLLKYNLQCISKKTKNRAEHVERDVLLRRVLSFQTTKFSVFVYEACFQNV